MRRRIVHGAGVGGLAVAEARQGRAVGADEKHRLDEVAAGLLQGERRQIAIVERAFRHDTVDRERQLLGDLRDRDFRDGGVAAPRLGKQPVRIGDGGLAALDRDIHQRCPMMRVLRGSAATV